MPKKISKRRLNAAQKIIDAQAPAQLSIDEAATAVFTAAEAEAHKHGLRVIVLVSAPAGEWRAKWGAAPVEQAWTLLRRVLLAVERMMS